MEALHAKSKTFKIFVPATDEELRSLLLLICTCSPMYSEQIAVTTDYSALVPARTITFAVPLRFPLSTQMVTDWLMSMSLLGGYVESIT